MKIESMVKARNTFRLVLTGIPIAIVIYLAYIQFFYAPKQVNSHLFKLDKVLSGHTADIFAVQFSPDGSWLASGSVDNSAKIWNTATGQLLLDLKQPVGVTSLAFTPDGMHLATAGYDGIIRLWKLPEGNVVKEIDAHDATIWTIDISPDGKTLASSGEDKNIKGWNIESGRLLNTLSGHARTVWDISFSPDGATLVSGSYDNTIKVWDSTTGALQHTLTGHTEAIVSIAYSHDGKLLVSTSDDKSIKLWNTNTWNLVRTMTVPEHVQGCAFSPDDTRVVTSGRDKTVIGEFLQNFFGDATVNKGVSMRLWDVTSGTLLQTFSHHANDVNDVAYSPDGIWIASGSSDKTIALWKQ